LIKISIVSICWNDLEGLQKTIASISCQTRHPDEYVVWDGGSSDGTVAYIDACHIVTRWKSEPDEGIADAFNKATKLALGDWILFLNSGDEFADPKVLEEMIKHLENMAPEVGVCFGDAFIVDPAGLDPDRRLSGSATLGQGSNPICHQAAFIRRDLQYSHPYDKRMRIGMDYDLWHRLAKKTKFVHVSRIVCRYRLGGISSSSGWGEHGIVMHHAVDWLNRGKKLGITDALLLVQKLSVFRIKKITESLIGKIFYLKMRSLLSR